jgi:hypothetical protein
MDAVHAHFSGMTADGPPRFSRLPMSVIQLHYESRWVSFVDNDRL